MKKAKQGIEKDPLWKNPGRLVGIDEIRTIECEDEERPEGLQGNPSHMMLATEEALHRAAPIALDFAGDVLGLRDEGPWRWQRPFLLSALHTFYREAVDAPAWLAVVPLRMPHEHRFGAAPVAARERGGQAHVIGSQAGLNRTKLILGLGIGEVDPESLLLAYGGQGERSYLLRQGRKRTLVRDGYGESYDELNYFADPSADAESIARVHVPAMSPYYDTRLRLLTTAALTCGRISRTTRGRVTQLIVTLQPEDGRTVALTPGRRSLRTYCLQYPLDRSLLTRGAQG